jgi:hypothetical protein
MALSMPAKIVEHVAHLLVLPDALEPLDQPLIVRTSLLPLTPPPDSVAGNRANSQVGPARPSSCASSVVADSSRAEEVTPVPSSSRHQHLLNVTCSPWPAAKDLDAATTSA